MGFFDIVFPLNIPPLTYHWDDTRGTIEQGMVVSAEVKKSTRLGIVLNKSRTVPAGSIKDIRAVHSERPVMNTALLKLLTWMAEYYLAPEGAVLKSMAILEFLEKQETKKIRRAQPPAPVSPHINVSLTTPSPETISRLQDAVSSRHYQAFLLTLPSFMHEISYALELIRNTRHAIVLVPEITRLNLLIPFFERQFGPRVAIMHGGLSKTERRTVFGRILEGSADIVIGTRLAVFAPLPSLSLLLVVEEQNRAYKNLEGVRYHGRDVAVMRCYLEHAAAILTTTVPSLESFFNALKGKYTALQPPEPKRFPRVDIIPMRRTKKVTRYLSQKTLKAAASAVKNGDSVLFFLNRKGYSLIQCAECGTTETCPACGIPLVYHKQGMILRCHYCSFSSRPPQVCRTCRSTRLETVGAGTERIEADIRKYLSAEAVRMERDSTKKPRHLLTLADAMGGRTLMIGTKFMKGTMMPSEGFKLCVLLNPDISLHLPDFRSAEFLYQETIGLSEYVKPDGTMMIQTAMPENDVFTSLRRPDHAGFLRKELSRRKVLLYPPFSRMIALTASSRTPLHKDFWNALPKPDEGTEVLGPIVSLKRGVHTSRIILKSAAKERLHLYARHVLKSLTPGPGTKIVADTDPISLQDTS